MGLPKLNDFNLDSDGHCFLCLNKIKTPVRLKQGGHEPEKIGPQHLQNCSVHYLARYLQMDLRKVFNDRGQIDPTLLNKVRRSRLKVELCEMCTDLNEKFSGLYEQLEKLEIEINSSLGLIHGQLVGAGRSDKHLTKFSSNSSMSNEVTQIMDVLREEATQKCFQKMLVSPRVEVEKLTKKQIDAELLKRQCSSGISKVQTEFEPPNENLLSDDDDRSYDKDQGETIDDDHGMTSDGQQARENDKIGTGTNTLVAISTALPSPKRGGKGKASINPNTGKWKCSACPMEFVTRSGSFYHYRSVHQKIRFRCAPCGKEFASRPAYNRHHWSVHVGVRFKCLVCDKLFTEKKSLQLHQRSAGCCGK